MFYALVKRIFDIAVGVVGVVILVPVTIIVKVAYIFSGDLHPIFYSQARIGKEGKTFTLLKYRSMIPNAEEKLEILMKEDQNIATEYATNKKLLNDPRITKVGKILRRFSIDELPQLLNVLVGQMSVVGNRPYLLSEKKEMGKFYDKIVKMKPGITGLWQVHGHNDVSFRSRLELESTYADIAGFQVDFNILTRTVKVVLTGNRGEK